MKSDACFLAAVSYSGAPHPNIASLGSIGCKLSYVTLKRVKSYEIIIHYGDPSWTGKGGAEGSMGKLAVRNINSTAELKRAVIKGSGSFSFL